MAPSVGQPSMAASPFLGCEPHFIRGVYHRYAGATGEMVHRRSGVRSRPPRLSEGPCTERAALFSAAGGLCRSSLEPVPPNGTTAYRPFRRHSVRFLTHGG